MPTAADVTPVDAGFFEKAGASPADAANLAYQHNAMAGRAGSDVRAAMSVEMRNLPPPRASAPAVSTVTPQQATDALQQHQTSQLQTELDATFAPPLSPSDYRVPEPEGGHTADTEKFSSDLRSALHQERIPGWAVQSIGEALASTTRQLANESPADAVHRNQDAESRLRGLWGKDHEANLATVDQFIESTSSRSPVMKQFWEFNGRALARNPLAVDVLLQIAKARSGTLR